MDKSSVLTNRCVMDERTLRKTYARIFRRTLYMFYFGAVLIASFSLLLMVLQGGPTPLPFFLLLGGILYLFIGIRMPIKQARRQIQRYEASGSGTSPEVAVWFDQEELTGCRAGMEELVHIPYESMKSVLPTRERIILWTREKQFVVLDPARFENGTEADFWRLMQEKCPEALPKSRRNA